MRFERENAKAIVHPKMSRLERELRKLRSEGPSSFAILTNDVGDFLQVAGGGGGCLLERRDAATGRHFRAWQEEPVVPFADGTELLFSGGRIALQSSEWFRMNQIVEIFYAFNAGEQLPTYVQWREISDMFG